MEEQRIEISYFKNGSADFFRMLEDENISFKKIKNFPDGTIVASGETIEIINAIGGASIVPSLATIIVTWLKTRASRKAIVTTKDNKIVHLEGYSEKEVSIILDKTRNLTIAQTKPDDDGA